MISKVVTMPTMILSGIDIISQGLILMLPTMKRAFIKS